jgi:glycosyltransferase involved in cell wall biosynthesis
MRVFLAGTNLLPEYGGPAFSVSRLAIALTEVGAEVGLWAPDQSAATTPLLPAESSVHRLIGSAALAMDRFGKADVIHDNGIWLPHNHRLAQLAIGRAIPRLVSTHGMLEPWALNYKRWKKCFAWWLYQQRDLKRARCHHTTAQTEAAQLERLGLGVPICVIPNGVDVPAEFSPIGENENRGGRRTALFLGRIHPKKGLTMLIEAWARVRPEGWRLQIAGPDEAGHRIHVENAVFAAGLSEIVSFIGPVAGEKKKSTFFGADLFVLPTHSENFGIVVAEALAHGLPVVTTTGAPWSRLPELGCGWWVDVSVDEIAVALRQATSLDAETLRAMGARGHEWVRAEFGWERVAKEFMATYEGLCSEQAAS